MGCKGVIVAMLWPSTKTRQHRVPSPISPIERYAIGAAHVSDRLVHGIKFLNEFPVRLARHPSRLCT